MYKVKRDSSLFSPLQSHLPKWDLTPRLKPDVDKGVTNPNAFRAFFPEGKMGALLTAFALVKFSLMMMD